MAEATAPWAGANVTSLAPEGHRRDLRIIEALLFASAEPMPEAELAARLSGGAHISTLMTELQTAYAGRGVTLRRVEDRWAFRTAEDLGYLLSREVVEQKKLSRAAMETLAIIAYHQPVTRADIEGIRGVAISRGTLDVLLEAGWVRLRGRRRTPGRPVTFGTTPAFLDHFGLGSVGDLPGIGELKAAGLLDSAVPMSAGPAEPEEDMAVRDDEDAFDDRLGADFADDPSERGGGSESTGHP